MPYDDRNEIESTARFTEDSSMILRPLLAAMAAAFALLPFHVSAAMPPNNCADPWWQDTLRCTLFPGEAPQANVDEVPRFTAGQAAPEYTRVFLEGTAARCADGTMPLIYVDKAVCTLPQGCGGGVKRGDPVESNRWLFSFTGGDSCSGERCGWFYAQPDARSFMGSSAKPVMKDIEGIHRGNPEINPVFAGYNRVRVEKCTFDRYMGRAAERGVETVLPDGRAVRYDTYHHGFQIIVEAFAALESGLAYTTFRAAGQADTGSGRTHRRACCGRSGGGNLVRYEEELPPLAEAETVLLIGHSNACHGLYHNADHLAALLEAMPGFGGDVRALFDENFQPSFENEAAFATTAPPGSDAYSSVTIGTSSARGESFTYDGAQYHATDLADLDYAAQGAVHDASCTAAHAASATGWICRDRHHVLLNHITMPFMVHEDFTDPNVDHLDAPNGFRVRFGTQAGFSWCPDAQPCAPRFDAAEFRARVEKQAQTLLTSAWTKSELARGADMSAAAFPTFFVWMPTCGQHEGAYDDDAFYRQTISTTATAFSMRQWLEEFMSAPRTGERRYQIDGAKDGSGRTMTTSKCK